MPASSAPFSPYFHPLHPDADLLEKPRYFTYPHFYSPHPLAILAAKSVQNYLEKEAEFDHNFGLNPDQKGMVIGKMFGVLVVRNKENKMGFLAAFSGKLAGTNQHSYFVPPVFDMLKENSFFLRESVLLNRLNAEIEELENRPAYQALKQEIQSVRLLAATELERIKGELKQAKILRDQKRKMQPFEKHEDLIRESQLDKIRLSRFKKEMQENENNLRQKLACFEKEIEQKKQERKIQSAALQQALFDEYTFLNAQGESKSLLDIFGSLPPAGAGECAAPKLLHYAFLHGLEPICMAEFWWGQSPKSEIRVHGQFYPACRGKCEPILKHMLSETPTDPNPMLQQIAVNGPLPVIYEDDYLLAVNKPAGFLSVPGIALQDSVAERIRLQYPQTEGPFLVHRLDMATSGILLIAKSKEMLGRLQFLFSKRRVKKRYVALLEGVPKEKAGSIDLPLRVDLDDRPRQLVCHQWGKEAHSDYEVLEVKNGISRVHFFPLSGRTHQLRVHAAHKEGLGCPILGDDLYGNIADRLYLHAAELEFIHPVSKEKIIIECSPDF